MTLMKSPVKGAQASSVGNGGHEASCNTNSKQICSPGHRGSNNLDRGKEKRAATGSHLQQRHLDSNHDQMMESKNINFIKAKAT